MNYKPSQNFRSTYFNIFLSKQKIEHFQGNSQRNIKNERIQWKKREKIKLKVNLCKLCLAIVAGACCLRSESHICGCSLEEQKKEA